MAKNGKSWLPTGGRTVGYRSAAGGKFVTEKTVASNPLSSPSRATSPSDRIEPVKTATRSATSPSAHFSLRDGTVITTVRKDVLDRALGRGEFGKK